MKLLLILCLVMLGFAVFKLSISTIIKLVIYLFLIGIILGMLGW